MKPSKFSISRLLLYFVLVSLFLFVSASVGQYLIETQGIGRQQGILLQGVIFTVLTLSALYIFKRKRKDLFKDIGLKGSAPPSRVGIGMILPFVLIILGILTAYLFGGIENVSLNLSSGVVIAILINTVTAFLYEAFPEEVFTRGLIFEELNKKFRFITSLLLQPLIFICVPVAVMVLQWIFFDTPFSITVDYVILLYAFGIALQLYRKYTGTLWMSIFFHVIYLEVTRYISIGGIHGRETALLIFDEAFDGFMALYLSFLFIVVLSIVVLSILLLMDKRVTEKHQL